MMQMAAAPFVATGSPTLEEQGGGEKMEDRGRYEGGYGEEGGSAKASGSDDDEEQREEEDAACSLASYSSTCALLLRVAATSGARRNHTGTGSSRMDYESHHERRVNPTRGDDNDELHLHCGDDDDEDAHDETRPDDDDDQHRDESQAAAAAPMTAGTRKKVIDQSSSCQRRNIAPRCSRKGFGKSSCEERPRRAAPRRSSRPAVAVLVATALMAIMLMSPLLLQVADAVRRTPTADDNAAAAYATTPKKTGMHQQEDDEAGLHNDRKRGGSGDRMPMSREAFVEHFLSTTTTAHQQQQHRPQRQRQRQRQLEDYDNQEEGEGEGRGVQPEGTYFDFGGPVHPEDHLVSDLPLLEAGSFLTKHYAGHLPASNDGDKKLFYWLFEPDTSDSNLRRRRRQLKAPHREEDIPLVIWLNGGPGCSSMDGLFIEHGPFQLQHDDDASQWRMVLNDYSWHKTPAYTLYIDQPVGTGLAFTHKGNYCKDDYEVDVDFYHFMRQFLLFHRDTFLTLEEGDDDGDGDDGGSSPLSPRRRRRWMMKRPLYFSGESHAGHYIPSMMDFILKMNDEEHKREAEGPPYGSDNDNANANAGDLPMIIPLSGAAIGNGWVDPYHQYAGAEAAYGMGLIDWAQKLDLDLKEKECQSDLERHEYQSSKCFKLLDDIIGNSDGSQGAKYKVSQYDYRVWESSHGARTFPPGHKDIEAYLGNVSGNRHSRAVTPPWDVDSATVLEALHATEATNAGQYYRECTDPPYNALAHQDGLGVVDELVRVLAHPTQPRMLFFNGVTDLICNHVGNEVFLWHLPWQAQTEWRLSKRYVWRRRDEEPAGYMKEYENLLFLKVLDSGHMVPLDLPEVAFDMLATFIYGNSFKDSVQALERSETGVDGGTGGNNNDGTDQSVAAATCPPCPECQHEEGDGPTSARNGSGEESGGDGRAYTGGGSGGDGDGGGIPSNGEDRGYASEAEGGGDDNYDGLQGDDPDLLHQRKKKARDAALNQTAVNHSIIGLAWIGALLGVGGLAFYGLFYNNGGGTGGYVQPGAGRAVVVRNDSDDEDDLNGVEGSVALEFVGRRDPYRDDPNNLPRRTRGIPA